MAPIMESVVISRPAKDVFAYVTDPSRLSEWQESLVSAHLQDDAPLAAGSRVVMTRRMGRQERTMTMEFSEFNPPTSWALRGIDGPIRAIVQGTIVPQGDGDRSQVTIALDFDGRGIGKLLVPLVVRRQVRSELPKNEQNLKERLESGS